MRRPISGVRAGLGAGALDQHVTFAALTETPDGYGGATQSWSAVHTAWAAVEALGGGEGGSAGSERSTRRISLTLYRTDAVAEAQRLEWDGRQWDVVSILRGGSREAMMTVEAEHVAGRAGQ